MSLPAAIVRAALREVGVEEVNGSLDHCVYIHRTGDTDTVFYVGKSKREARRNRFPRPYSHTQRNRFWNAVAKKHGWRAEIVAYFETVSEADAEERRLIAFYGKRVMGGLLCNLADGGEGNAGCPRTEEWKVKMRITMTGRKLTAEHRRKLSEARAGKTLSESHKAAIRKASSTLKNFRLNDPEIQSKAQAARKLVKTKPRTREHQDKINAANRGQKRSVNSKLKMSAAAKNRCHLQLK